jgi:secretion/DNA translocation related CpaE-like protein
VTADAGLLDDLLRLAATAGVEPEMCSDAGAARRSWSAAPLVLLGADQGDAVLATGLGRHPSLVLVGDDPDDRAVWQQAVALGARQVVFLPEAQSWLVERLSSAHDDGGSPRALLLAVVGGRGGAGASTLAVALALAGARRSMRTFLVDADPLGGGLDLVLGGEDLPGLRWSDLAETRGRLASEVLLSAVPTAAEVSVLSCDRTDVTEIPQGAMRAVLDAATRGSDLVVVDLPRSLGAAAQAVLGRADRVLLVVPAEVRATASAGSVAASLRTFAGDLGVVVRGPAPGDLEAPLVAEALGLPLAGHCRAEPGLAAALDRGEPPGRRRGPLARLADSLLEQSARPGRAA